MATSQIHRRHMRTRLKLALLSPLPPPPLPPPPLVIAPSTCKQKIHLMKNPPDPLDLLSRHRTELTIVVLDYVVEIRTEVS